MYRVSIEGQKGIGKTTLLKRLCGEGSGIKVSNGDKHVEIYISESDPTPNLCLYLYDVTNTSTMTSTNTDIPTLSIGNKSDLLQFRSTEPDVISALTGRGIDTLVSLIYKELCGGPRPRKISWCKI